MSWEIAGLPIHPLVVHATVIILPLAAVLVIAAAVSTKFRSWAGYLPLGVAVAGMIFAPLTTASGEGLEESLASSAAIEKHAELGDLGVAIAVAQLVAAAGLWWFTRQGKTFGRGLVISVQAIAIVISIVTIVMIVLIGHSGAEAAWADTLTGSAG